MKFQRKITITYIHQVQNQRYFMEDGIPNSRLILPAIGTPTYKLAKFCNKLLKPATTNEYTTKDSLSFVKQVEEFDPNLIV